MDQPNFLHEIIFGTLAANILLLGGVFRFAWNFYKKFDTHMDQHHELWEDYQYRESLRKAREDGNLHRSKVRKLREEKELE